MFFIFLVKSYHRTCPLLILLKASGRSSSSFIRLFSLNFEWTSILHYDPRRQLCEHLRSYDPLHTIPPPVQCYAPSNAIYERYLIFFVLSSPLCCCCRLLAEPHHVCPSRARDNPRPPLGQPPHAVDVQRSATRAVLPCVARCCCLRG